MRALFLFTLLVISFSAAATEIVFQTSATENLRILKNDILEVLVKIPPGTTLSVSSEAQPETHLYRLTNGSIERSSNGFLPDVQIQAVKPEYVKEFPVERIAEINKTRNWVTVTILPVRDSGEFPAINIGKPEAEYLMSFEETGKPKFNFTKYYQTRFPGRLNLAIDPNTLPESEVVKWNAIMNELSKAADRSNANRTSYLYMPLEEAKQASIDYEQKNLISKTGAWTIAVKATAVRHDFPNVPCAEFMSEMLRQAYTRAGYDVFEDFNKENDTYLIWSSTAAVVNLANTLVKAGWIPWELAYHRPPTGAIMAHFRATSPGHVYMNAGMDGGIIIDNGSPAGRQLYRTTDKIIKMMYYGGVFFLPPGIVPETW